MTGRPSIYSEELADAICERLACGESLKSISSADDMPVQQTVYNWLINKPGFLEKYTRARELQADTLADETLDIADDARNDWMLARGDDEAEIYRVNGENIQRSRLRIDQRKWFVSKVAPKKYGDKLVLGGDADSPVQIVVVSGVPRADD
jgi:hypothetical protein